MKKFLSSALCIIIAIMCVGCNNSQSSNLECSNCGLAITDNAKFCSNCGEPITNNPEENNNENKQCSHKWQEATCIALKTCTICKATEGTYAGHSWIEATCTTPQTCSVCKATEGSELGHTNSEYCSRCEYVNKSMAIENAKKAIYVYGIDLDMDSAGGVDTYITWKNVSQKEIKYIHFYVQYYNRVKDVIKDDIDDSTTVILTATGPFPYGKGNYDVYSYSSDGSAESLYFTIPSGYKNDEKNGWADRYWEAPFYNTTAVYIKIVEVEIEYMDGTYYTISDVDAIAAVVGSGEHPNSWSTDDTGDDYLR